MRLAAPSLAAALFATLAACASADPEDITVLPGEVTEAPKADGADSGQRAEIKVTVEEAAIDDTRDRLGLDGGLAEDRDIWFYDTPSLDLFESNAVLRARKIDGADDDSTVKIRPLGIDEVDATWLEEAGFKCELDRTPTSTVSSCSLTVEQDQGEIDDVGDGERAIDKLFSSEQEDFLAEHGPAFDWDDIAPLGPIEARLWRLEADSLPAEMTAELWRLPGEELLELSIKVSPDEAADALDELIDWLAERDIPLSSAQETKTRRALELLSGK